MKKLIFRSGNEAEFTDASTISAMVAVVAKFADLDAIKAEFETADNLIGGTFDGNSIARVVYTGVSASAGQAATLLPRSRREHLHMMKLSILVFPTSKTQSRQSKEDRNEQSNGAHYCAVHPSWDKSNRRRTGRASGISSGTVHSSFRRGTGISRRVSSERTIRAAARMILMASGMYLLGASLQKEKV